MGSCYSHLGRATLIETTNNKHQAPIERDEAATTTALPSLSASSTSSVLTTIPQGIVTGNNTTTRPKSVAFNEILNVKQFSPSKTKVSPKRLQQERWRKKKRIKNNNKNKIVEVDEEGVDEEPVLLSYQVTFHPDPIAELVVLSSDSSDEEDDNNNNQRNEFKLECQQSKISRSRSKVLLNKLKATSKRFFHSKSTTQLTTTSGGGGDCATDLNSFPSAIGMSQQQQPRPSRPPSKLRPPSGVGGGLGNTGTTSISSSTSHLPRLNFGFVRQKTDNLNRAVSNGEGIDTNKSAAASKISRLRVPKVLTGAKSMGNVPGEMRNTNITTAAHNRSSKFGVVNSCDNLAGKQATTNGSTSTLSSATSSSCSGGFRTPTASASRLSTTRSGQHLANITGTTSSTSGVSTASSGRFQKSSSSSNMSIDEYSSPSAVPPGAPPKLPPKPPSMSGDGAVRAAMRTTASMVRPQTAHIVNTAVPMPAGPTTSHRTMFTPQQQQRLNFLYGSPTSPGDARSAQQQQQQHMLRMRGMTPTLVNATPGQQFVAQPNASGSSQTFRRSMLPATHLNGGGKGNAKSSYKAPSIYNAESKIASCLSYPYKRIAPPSPMSSGLVQQQQQQPSQSSLNPYLRNYTTVNTGSTANPTNINHNSRLREVPVATGGQLYAHQRLENANTAGTTSRITATGYQGDRRAGQPTFDHVEKPYYYSSPNYVRKAATRLNMELAAVKEMKLKMNDNNVEMSNNNNNNLIAGTCGNNDRSRQQTGGRSVMDSNGNFVANKLPHQQPQQQSKPSERVLTTDELGERLKRLALLSNANDQELVNGNVSNAAGDYYPHYLTYNVKDRRWVGETGEKVGGGGGAAGGGEYDNMYNCSNSVAGGDVASKVVKDNCLTSTTTAGGVVAGVAAAAASASPSRKVNITSSEQENKRRQLRLNEEVSSNNNNNNNNYFNYNYDEEEEDSGAGSNHNNNNNLEATSTEELVTSDEDEADPGILSASQGNLARRPKQDYQPELCLSTFSAVSVCSTASTASSFYYENHKEPFTGAAAAALPGHEAGLVGAETKAGVGFVGGVKKSATCSTTTSQSDTVSNKDFLIDDEIADQPELEFMNLGRSNSTQRPETEVMAAAANTRLRRPVYMPIEKVVGGGGTLSSKTLTPASPSNVTRIPEEEKLMLVSAHNELECLISQHSSSAAAGPGDSNYASLPAYYHDESSAATSVAGTSLGSTPTNGTAVNSPGSSPLASVQKASSMIGPGQSKLRKRHSYTSGGGSSPKFSGSFFPRPRPLSFVEKEDGSIGVGQNSVPALMQDVKNIKTLLYRLQGELQNAETQNPFETALSSSRFFNTTGEASLESLQSATERMSLLSDDSEESAIHFLKEENMDLKQSNRLMKEQLIEKDRTIRLLQQQMAKYTTSLFVNGSGGGGGGYGVNAQQQSNATTQTDPPSTGGIDPRALSDGSDGQLVR